MKQHTVVVGYDHTPSSERALAAAGREAAWRGASVTVVHAFHWVPAATPMTYAPLRVEETVKEAATEIATLGGDFLRYRYPGMTVHEEVVSGAPAQVLATAARDADLLVVGDRGRGGFADLLLGSVSLRTVGQAPCPVMVVRGGEDEEREPRDTILVAVDIEDPADEVLDFAFAEASRRSARLKAINVWDISWAVYVADSDEARRASLQAVADLESALKRLLAPWQAKYPDVRLDYEAADGTPSAVLNRATTDADLIVAGAHRHGGGRDGVWVGPIAHALLQHAACQVAIVPRA